MVAPVVIVGASLGGLRTAESLRRFGYLGPIQVFGDEPHLPYNRPPLSKEVLVSGISHEAVAFPLKNLIADITWKLSTRIVSLNTDEKTVKDASGEDHNYSSLVIATGLSPTRPDVIPENSEGIHVLRNLDDAIALRSDLKPGAKVVILGSGFIGCEVASTAIKLGAEVTVISSSELPLLRPLGMEFATELKNRLEVNGIRFLLNDGIKEIISATGSDSPRIQSVRLKNDDVIDCDVLVSAVGSSANTGWLSESTIDVSDGVLTNGAMQALDLHGDVVTDVYAVGDVARFPNPLFDEVPRRVEHWNIPTETAKRVSRVIAAKENQDSKYSEILDESFAPIPSFWSDQFDMHILGYGNLGLAKEIKLLDGKLDEEFIFGYFLAGKLVGVSGIGMRGTLQAYREKL
jgi:NADPH-dependent 2,4-dienoyl-CoA reductase/sulfur reductase-like enzyme